MQTSQLFKSADLILSYRDIYVIIILLIFISWAACVAHFFHENQTDKTFYIFDAY